MIFLLNISLNQRFETFLSQTRRIN